MNPSFLLPQISGNSLQMFWCFLKLIIVKTNMDNHNPQAIPRVLDKCMGKTRCLVLAFSDLQANCSPYWAIDLDESNQVLLFCVQSTSTLRLFHWVNWFNFLFSHWGFKMYLQWVVKKKKKHFILCSQS